MSAKHQLHARSEPEPSQTASLANARWIWLTGVKLCTGPPSVSTAVRATVCSVESSSDIVLCAFAMCLRCASGEDPRGIARRWQRGSSSNKDALAGSGKSTAHFLASIALYR